VTFEDGQGSSSVQNSGQIDRTFNTVGNFRFRCTVHSGNFTSGMVGSVMVQ
jgi:plastocyanin